MARATEGLKPELVWKYFEEVARVPRCSGNEAQISKYVAATAKRLGLAAKVDEVGNVVVRKPASPGRESARSVVLQGHLDMVGEKNKDKVHNFEKDPIELVRKDNLIMASGTTLGADNGIAIAANLAIMEDKSLEHGPLEFLFTVDEERGLTGAKNISSDFLQSKILLNLDSEEEGELYVGCAGGRDTVGTWKVEFDSAPAQATAALLKVTGLRGGHSGLEIDKGRGNALKIINRVLIGLSAYGARLSSLEGGNKRNAIPREADARLFIPKKAWEQAAHLVSQCNATIKAEYATVEPGLEISLTGLKGASKGKVIRNALQKKLCKTISALPHGVIKMSPDIPGLVQTSTNVAIVSTGRKALAVATSQRSSVASEIDEICQMVANVFDLGGAEVEASDGYPGWKPNLDSEILKIAKETYRSLYGKEPEVKAVHAGLECGIIGEKFPGMDMVSFGPTLQGVHSPDEKIYIDTVEKFWNYLLAILRNVN
ncbi:MAG: aminoacyl-histidine dipeptidase [Acidobacteriia bacterium]|nr:aminoacyl-histidine dipeptidase [Terriglobia bacterium]